MTHPEFNFELLATDFTDLHRKVNPFRGLAFRLARFEQINLKSVKIRVIRD
jgi:hypothetical protein